MLKLRSTTSAARPATSLFRASSTGTRERAVLKPSCGAGTRSGSRAPSGGSGQQRVGARPAVSRPQTESGVSRGQAGGATNGGAGAAAGGVASGTLGSATSGTIGTPASPDATGSIGGTTGASGSIGGSGSLGARIGRGRGIRRSWPWLQRQQQRPWQRFRAGGQRVHRREGLGSVQSWPGRRSWRRERSRELRP